MTTCGINRTMMTLEEIEAAVEKLSPEELKRFRAWLDEIEERLFDERIARDANAGKLDKLEAKALAEDEAGTTSEL